MLVFFIILIILLLIYFSGITIKIEELEIEKNKKIEIKKFKLKIYFLLLNKIKAIKIQITKKQIEKINFHRILNNFKGKSIKQDKNIIIKNLNYLQIKVKQLDIKAKLGLSNAVLLAYLVAIINIVLSIIYVKISKGFKKENYKYIIKPHQTDKFYLKISINCIINVKIANIINMIIKNRSEKNERTSNRSFNGNCHEQYTRYGRCKHYYRSTN